MVDDCQVDVANLTYRAETLVVKLAQSFAYKSLVVPVMSSHWAEAVPPGNHTRWEGELVKDWEGWWWVVFTKGRQRLFDLVPLQTQVHHWHLNLSLPWKQTAPTHTTPSHGMPYLWQSKADADWWCRPPRSLGGSPSRTEARVYAVRLAGETCAAEAPQWPRG